MSSAKSPLTFADFGAISVLRLKGVGEAKAKSLAAAEIHTVLDILTHYPRRYIDRTREATIESLEVGDEGMVLVEVGDLLVRRTRNRRTIVDVGVRDATGRMSLIFFNQPWRERQLKKGMQILIFGKMDLYKGRHQMTNPVVDLVGDRTGRVLPIYPQSEKAGLHSWEFASWVEDALAKASPRGFAEPLDEGIRDRLELVDRAQAFAGIHFPSSLGEVSEARRRLVFDELLRIQLLLVLRKRSIEASTTGIRHRVNGRLLDTLIDRLPFDLTVAQSRVIDEIESDLESEVPMHRLLQGDVGSGKTIAALAGLLAVVEGGHQGALMVPTEVLADQHFLSISTMLDGFMVTDRDPTSLLRERELRVVLFTSKMSSMERDRVLVDLAAGQIDLVIGTHALIQEGIEFASLGMVVIDEQHRFGVDQRAALRHQGRGEAIPDILVMTATPIPRTTAMTVYGDLDVSILDELPPTRTPITTIWHIDEEGTRPESSILGTNSETSEPGAWDRVRSELSAGRQAYVVCPLIDESDKLEVASAQETNTRLVQTELEGFNVGLLHGRLPSNEKEQVMGLFRNGTLDVLVATTVIEVGVDVPNASVMVILGADRFGIAQLHQLRGRVGRGAAKSWCYLIGEGATSDSRARLDALVKTTDGFELAEVDLDLRGEGTIMSDRQKGRNDLKLASLRRDKTWVTLAREVAFELVDASPGLAAHPLLSAEIDFLLDDEEADYLLKS